MASSIPLFNKVANSFLFRKVQNDPIVQSIASVFKKRQAKNISTESQSGSSKTSNLKQEIPQASPKSKLLFFVE